MHADVESTGSEDMTPGSSRWLGAGLLLSVVRRYEAVFALVAGIVLLVILSGGTFVSSGVNTADSGGVTPFDESGQPGVVAPTPPPLVAQPPVLPPLQPPSGVGTPVSPPESSLSEPPEPAPTARPSFADGGAFGTAVPFASVPGPGTVSAVAVGAAGDVWASLDQPGTGAATQVRHLSSAGALEGTFTLPAAQAGVTALAIDRAGTLFAASRTPAAVYAVEPTTGGVRELAKIPDVTPCVPAVMTTNCDGSVIDAAPVITALAFDRLGQLFVADAGQGAIWRVAPGGTVKQWTVDSTWVNPARPAGPAGIAFDGGGNLVLVLASTLTEDDGVVLVQKVTPQGDAGERTELARTGAGSRPAGLALGVTGKVYVSLGATGRVLVLDRNGKQVGVTPTASAPALVAPAGLGFRGSSLLVAAGTAPGAPGGQVLRLPVGEIGGRAL